METITRADARTRLETAKMYLTAAELIVDETVDEASTVANGNAVLAGIAAADAICADASGERYRVPDHRAAADHLERVTGDKVLGRTLRELVDLKDAGHYGVSNVSRTNARKALRRASRLIAEAAARLR
ncbi:MAG: hypothetical protein JJE52_07640 [Acidimicrobiia bacterium]|nr:hypothetical protein [Acidimicrobiia bacterium]